MNTMRKLVKMIIDKNFRTMVLGRRGFYKTMPDDIYLKRVFKSSIGRTLDLENPKTYNEKLQWLKINERRPEFTMMVDKYKVRNYIKQVLGEEYLIPLLGVWDEPDAIDFNSLPDQFVLKCNHNSGRGMCICTNKEELDVRSVKKNLEKGLKEEYYYVGREWPYKDVPKKIIAEKYMIDPVTKDLRDYKFYCFNGKVKFVMINSDRNSDQPTKADYFDRSFNWLDFRWGYEHSRIKPEKPHDFEKMIEIAEKLSQNMKHARIDLYYCANKIYFGEITFFDGSGFDKIEPVEWIKVEDDLVCASILFETPIHIGKNYNTSCLEESDFASSFDNTFLKWYIDNIFTEDLFKYTDYTFMKEQTLLGLNEDINSKMQEIDRLKKIRENLILQQQEQEHLIDTVHRNITSIFEDEVQSLEVPTKHR